MVSGGLVGTCMSCWKELQLVRSEFTLVSVGSCEGLARAWQVLLRAHQRDPLALHNVAAGLRVFSSGPRGNDSGRGKSAIATRQHQMLCEYLRQESHRRGAMTLSWLADQARRQCSSCDQAGDMKSRCPSLSTAGFAFFALVVASLQAANGSSSKMGTGFCRGSERSELVCFPRTRSRGSVIVWPLSHSCGTGLWVSSRVEAMVVLRHHSEPQVAGISCSAVQPYVGGALRRDPWLNGEVNKHTGSVNGGWLGRVCTILHCTLRCIPHHHSTSASFLSLPPWPCSWRDALCNQVRCRGRGWQGITPRCPGCLL